MTCALSFLVIQNPHTDTKRKVFLDSFQECLDGGRGSEQNSSFHLAGPPRVSWGHTVFPALTSIGLGSAAPSLHGSGGSPTSAFLTLAPMPWETLSAAHLPRVQPPTGLGGDVTTLLSHTGLMKTVITRLPLALPWGD